MLIVGAKGFAKEVLEVCRQLDLLDQLCFFDNISKDISDQLFNEFVVIKSFEKAQIYFENVDRRFTIGIGSPLLRKKMTDSFVNLGGYLTSTISLKADI